MKRISCVLLFVFTASLFAVDIHEKLATILPETLATELLAKGALTSMVYKHEGTPFQLLPNVAESEEIKNSWNDADAVYSMENLFLYPKNEKQLQRKNDVDEISVILRSISQLKGITYFSTEAQSSQVLYEESCFIDNLTSKQPIKDPLQGTADGLQLTVYQHDRSLGDIYYEYRYRQDSESVAFFAHNLTTVKVKFIPIIGPDNLHITLFVHDMGDYLLVYGLTQAGFLPFPGILKNRINASFVNRVNAIYDWFITQYEKK